MKDAQLTLLQIKSELMDLITGENVVVSYEKCSKVLKLVLYNHFEINEADFFIVRDNRFIPIYGRKLGEKKKKSVPFQTNDNSFSISTLKEFHSRGYRYADDYLLLYTSQSEPLGLLLLSSTSKWRVFSQSTQALEFEKVVSQIIQSLSKLVELSNEEESFRRLFSVTELFNSTMDSQVILEAIIATVTEAFPSFEVDLLLSHEQRSLSRTFKLLDFMNERASTMNAFVSGDLTAEDVPEKSERLVNSPIKGRQGIYGVLQLKSPIDYTFTTNQIKFITKVAKTAGSALENANLYDQSYHVIKELQLVNETSRKLNGNLDFGEMVLFLKQQLMRVFKPNEIAFVFYNKSDKHEISKLSSDFFRTLTSSYYIEYASSYFATGKGPLFEANFRQTLKEEVPYESIIAVPITNQEDVVGFVVLLHADKYYFSFDSFKLMRSLISHSSLAFTNSMLRDQLQELVDKDHLTKLYTRSYLDKMIGKTLMDDDRGVFLLIDVDNFKNVNDTYGHAVGDVVLKDISSVILSEVGNQGFAARWGGEEIAIYLPRVGESEGVALSKRLLNRVPSVTDPRVTISIGMKSWSSQMQITFKSLFQYTDAALYTAKNNGKNQLVIYGSTSS